MGTNYYVEEKEPCSCCGRSYEKRHIGKSSAGWVFALRIYPDENINTWDDWQVLLNNKIKDEYGKPISKEEMIDIVTKREWKREEKPYGYFGWADFHANNNSTDGPNGLLRSRLGPYCQGHGEGTWDYHEREFS